MAKKAKLWQDIHAFDPKLYLRLRHGVMGTLVNLPGALGRRIALMVYGIARRLFGFN